MLGWLRRTVRGGAPPEPDASAIAEEGEGGEVDGAAAAEEVAGADESANGSVEDAGVLEAAETPGPDDGATCPSCAFWIVPAPTSSRRCPRCRERIVVRRFEGRVVYFTEAAVVVFEAERQREADEARWTAERREWLRLSRIVGATEAQRTRIEDRPASAEAVAAARDLYLTGVEARVKAARRARQWSDVARLRREQAAALYHEAGSPVPPPDEVLDIHREAAAAQLRQHAGAGKYAELIGATCCKACRADDGKAFKIADELRSPRLPHAGCPRGLCACEWWLSLTDPTRRRRRKPRATATKAPQPSDGEAGA